LCKCTERSKPTDSLDWSRKFDIFSISRLSLNASGIPVELVTTLTDEDMHAIADEIAHVVIQEPVEKIAEFVARLYLAEKKQITREEASGEQGENSKT
jgi:hypothetical protein